MKKLFIQGGQGSGKTNAVRKITEGKKTIVLLHLSRLLLL